jgi:ATP-dependent DNA helicase RecG
MTQIITSKSVNRQALSSALRKAIAIERRALYADFQGRRTTFSSFMRQTAARLSKLYPYDSAWVTIRGLFREYPNMDVGTRISIVKRAEDLLSPLLNENFEGFKELKVESDSESYQPTKEAAKIKAEVNAPRAEPEESKSQTGTAIEPRSGGQDAATNLGTKQPAAYSEFRQTANAKAIPATKPPQALSKPAANAAARKDNAISNEATEKRPVARTEAAQKAKVRDADPGTTDVQFVKGVGPKFAAVLNQMGINTVEDLLRHYPRRHLDFQNRLKICDLEVGQEVTILGTIRSVSAFQSKNRNISIVTATIHDGSGSITVTRFIGGKSNKYLLDRYKEQLPKGGQVIASGIVERDNYGRKFTLKNAEVELLGFGSDGEGDDSATTGDAAAGKSIHVGRLVPVYPLTEGLSLRHLRVVIYNALESYGAYLKDVLPKDIKTELNLLDLEAAISGIHFPLTPEGIEDARRRLVFDELFLIQLQMAVRRHKFSLTENALSFSPKPGGLIEQMRSHLPFKLTGAQERVFQEIARDLASSKPMHRLVQGDVGSGKTIVALLAALVAIDNGFQAVVMAPTEILAEQHYRQFQRLLTPLGLRCAVVLGKQGQKERRQIRQDLLAGQVNIAVGTHALLEEDVEFKNLGLIIIDEQHRFGVKQRARLKAKGISPELLTMTATPIPRTLALTMHGDLDVSEIDELPPGRKPVETRMAGASKKKELFDFVRTEVAKGRQIYIVFPLIEESETLAAKAATQEYQKLKDSIFPDLRIGLMHGKLKPQEKDSIMDEFRKHNYDILVSTTVIEVGVDVPNASVMIIENADRFGLAQLHQLRGRVGRGAEQSYCFLIADNKSPTTRQRLEVLTQTNDGFVVAEKDLEIRGPGEFLGFRQSGLPDLLLADLVKDTKILEEARNCALKLVKEDPDFIQNPALKALIDQKTEKGQGEILHSG